MQWQVSTDGVNFSNAPGASTSATYTFTTTAALNGNQYRAVFTNSVGFVNSNPATLTVNSGPVVTTQPSNQTVDTGASASFSAAASGTPAPTVQWLVSTDGVNFSPVSGGTATTLTFPVLPSDNGKQYKATFTNAVGNLTTNTVTLSVYFGPVITTQPANQSVALGTPVTFTAAANGNPTPGVQWYVSSDGVNFSALAGKTATTLTFAALAADSGKQYRATFTNTRLSSTSVNANSNPATLTVSNLPQTINFTQPSDTSLNAGPVPLTASSTSGLAVAFASTTPATCSVAPGATQATLSSVGSCTIQATQSGNANFAAATPVSKTFSILPGNLGVVDYPNSTGTVFQGVNHYGQISGYYTLVDGSTHSFVYQNGAFTPIPDYAGSTSTIARGINNNGIIVGDFVTPGGGGSFLYNENTHVFTPLTVNGGINQSLYGVDTMGDLVGYYTANGIVSGFEGTNNPFLTITYPSATSTKLLGVNGTSGVSPTRAVGEFLDGGGTKRGFLSVAGGGVLAIDYPGAATTSAAGIYALTTNGSIQIVGSYTNAGSAVVHGFTQNGLATFQPVDFPGTGVTATNLNGINDAGVIVGSFTNAVGNHGLIVNPGSQGNNATLVSILVTPTNPSITKGSTQQFAATGTYSDNSTKNITSTVTWISGTTATATITAAGGLSTAVNTGTSTITAGLSGVTGSTLLTVTPATLQSIAVTPVNPKIAKGATQQFTAMGTFSDSTTVNITSQVTWNSATTATATIDSSGLATSVTTGATNITASMSGVTSPASVLTVSPTALVSIAVTPSNPTIAKGQTRQFTATATYSDNSTLNITSTVTWNSATTAAATINASGLATSVAPGTSNITASSSGVTSLAQLLTVTPAALVSIAVTPGSPSIIKGATRQFTATGTYTDATTQNITATATWNSATTATATINASGLATGVNTGTTNITASLSGLTSPPVVLTVTPAVLLSIAVTPASPTIVVGTNQQFTATGTYSDASTLDITASVTWNSATTATATINASGLATSVAAGTSNITAALGGVTSPADLLTVTPVNGQLPQTITFTQPPDIPMGGGAVTLTATASSNLPVSFASTTPAICTVTNAAVTPVAVGSCTIQATQAGNVLYAPAAPVNRTLSVVAANLKAVDYPGATSTVFVGVNHFGQISGNYTLPDSTTHSFVYQNGVFTKIPDYAGASSTIAHGINDSGVVVGDFVTPTGGGGFAYNLTTKAFSLLQVAGGSGQSAWGVDNIGDFVGFATVNGAQAGFQGSGNPFQNISYPGATATKLFGINGTSGVSSTRAVGEFVDGGGATHGFISVVGGVLAIDYPAATRTSAAGIYATNSNGSIQIVGNYTNSGSAVVHGFLQMGLGVPANLDFPAVGVTATNPNGLNDAGTIVGSYTNAAGTHGFIKTTP